MSPAMAGSTSLSPNQRQPVSIQPAAIQPSVPHTRMAPNSFSESSMLAIAIEFVRARVGAYRRQYTSISTNIVLKSVVRATTINTIPPVSERNPITRSVEKYRSATWPPTIGAMIVASGSRA